MASFQNPESRPNQSSLPGREDRKLGRYLSDIEKRLGPRPNLTLVVADMTVREIWINGRAPLITVHDYDWGETDRDAAFDSEGFAYSQITWRRPAWRLGLSLNPIR